MTKRKCCDNEMPDAFMESFKYYKSNNPKPSLEKVLFVTIDNRKMKDIICDNIFPDSQLKILGLKKPSEWNIAALENNPGLIYIKNPFTTLGQRHWIRKCLEQYTRKPNKTNIDIEMHLDCWWTECFKHGQRDEKLLKKMRWATLGYHHNWDTKVYKEESKNDIPGELSELCGVVSQILDFRNFRAEAAIVNYYHMGSTLSAHTDHSEINLDAPLFSFSFGQSAIFLIGGQDKAVEPTALMLNSGDIVVMSKEARLCYHAVPKILPAPSEPWNDSNELKAIRIDELTLKHVEIDTLLAEMNRNIDEEEWSKFCKYIEKSRININVRQVLKESQKHLNENDFY